MHQFFEAVKAKVGQIATKVFIANDATAYINTWTSVMSKHENHPICTWHLEKSWGTNLNNIKNHKKH